MVKCPWEYPWSSAKVHIKKGEDDIIDSSFQEELCTRKNLAQKC
jgi:hypothetical protein